MKKMLYLSLLIGINVQAETVFKIDNKKQNEFQVIDSKNQWLIAEEKCDIIESYNTIGDWNPTVLNQSSSFNQERIIQNFDRISCIMQEYNERLNQYREIGESTIKVEEKESDIENRLINVTDTGLTEIGEVFNCGAYTPSLNTILSVGTFNVSQSCQQNQEGKYLYSTGESYTYNESVKNKNINKNVVATKENETITNLSCTNWNNTLMTLSNVTQSRQCNQEIKNDIVIRDNQVILHKNIKTEQKNNTEQRVVNIECSSNGNTAYSIITYNVWPYYEEYCYVSFNGVEIKYAHNNNMSCGDVIKDGYRYYSNNLIETGSSYNQWSDSTENYEIYETCRYLVN